MLKCFDIANELFNPFQDLSTVHHSVPNYAVGLVRILVYNMSLYLESEWYHAR